MQQRVVRGAAALALADSSLALLLATAVARHVPGVEANEASFQDHYSLFAGLNRQLFEGITAPEPVIALTMSAHACFSSRGGG